MNTTTLNMTTLDGGVIIKKGEGGGAIINNQDKVVDITENGTIEVVADSDFTGLGKVTINTEVSGETINNQDKSVDITENGTTEVVADDGYTGLGKVTINTEVSGGGSTPPSGGESGDEWGYFLLNWGEQTSGIVTLFSSVVRVSEYSIWGSLSSISNPTTISKIDGCAINLSMKIRNDEMGISSLTSIKEYFISALGENYNELLGQMGFTPITKEQFYSLD